MNGGGVISGLSICNISPAIAEVAEVAERESASRDESSNRSRM